MYTILTKSVFTMLQKSRKKTHMHNLAHMFIDFPAMPCHGMMSAPFCSLCHIIRVNLKMWYKPLLMRFRGTLCSGKPSYPSCTSCSLDALASASNFAPGDCGGWCSDAFAEAVDGANCHLEPGEEMDWRMDVRFIAGVFFMFIHDFSPGNLFYKNNIYIYNYLRRRIFCSEVPNNDV